ncbi:MAG: hypothetical protein COU25_00125 [Candidatus Levybacteria bacterium CG10_big_fil_rev_8_21_14_0_10_35_13]|nr:MAG: hypothetical protein COU25_00125 [Candidatus Levybacteria bacterium CG10_big_fil_rev_8_21_14_0_10_35_13]
MGKIRIKTIGDETQEQEEKKKSQRRRENKKPVTTKTQNEIKILKRDDEQIFSVSETSEPSVVAREELENLSVSEISETQRLQEKPAASTSNVADANAVEITTKASASAKALADKSANKQKTKKSKFAKKSSHSQKYNDLLVQVDRSKVYSLNEALELLKKLKRGKFDETVELHINTAAPSLSGSVTLPHGTGKKTRVAVVDDNLIAEIEKGIINFDILVSIPGMMPKLAKVAKVLGPRGLMPNPKNGTITEKPEDLVKKYEGGQINFKTEGKNPLLHLTVGKMSFGENKLSDNIEAMIDAVRKSNIVNATLKSTMSPGIKLKI